MIRSFYSFTMNYSANMAKTKYFCDGLCIKGLYPYVTFPATVHILGIFLRMFFVDVFCVYLVFFLRLSCA